MITNSLMALGFNPGKNLLGACDFRNPETVGENIALRQILIRHISQETLQFIRSEDSLINELRGWKNTIPYINLAKHPLLAVNPELVRKAWPEHKRIFIYRNKQDVISTMNRRGWSYWRDSHYDLLYKSMAKAERKDDLIFDYEMVRSLREAVVINLAKTFNPEATPIQIRNATSAIRPKIRAVNQKIYIACPSLADDKLIPTIKDCFDNALDPQNITFAIYDQRNEELAELDELPYRNQIKYKRVPTSEAKGVGKARAGALEFLEDEYWYLQIDSHMKFARHWDSICFDQWDLCDQDNAILSTGLPGCTYEHNRKENLNQAFSLEYNGFNPFGVPVIRPGKSVARELKPYLHQLMVAHFMFCKSEVVKKVHIDPRIYFMGEEMLYSLRLFTHGYNIFAPFKSPMLHYYAPSHARPRQWQLDPKWRELTNKSSRIIRTAFNCLKENESPEVLGYYGLGSTRSLEDFESFLGVCFMAERKKFRGYRELRKEQAEAKQLEPEPIKIVQEVKPEEVEPEALTEQEEMPDEKAKPKRSRVRTQGVTHVDSPSTDDPEPAI